ncbi:MAG: alkyl hydroperoxide reductase/Thiol specific antioxidant/Mal allergen [Bacteroidetes bacterium]|jgi:thiol-disulfide isomerase/thioredoxin|nr:alkyl hydroperoxide reductase/Thiol specific antioxidant/Mal allergen [Bacteroidota bacterium]
MKSGKRIGIFLIAVLAGLLGLYMYKKYRVAPSISLLKQEVIDAAGKKSTLETYNGKALIISYYASWCGDCIKELKELNAIKDTALPNVTVVCITDETAEKLINFQTSRKFPFEFYRIARPFSDIGVHTIPVTYLLNKKGEVIYNKVGAVKWKDASFREYAKKLLGN